MSRWIVWLAILAGMIAFSASCANGLDAEKMVITVQCATGVDGEPKTGSYDHDKDAMVSYNYSAATGYENILVRLDGQPVAAGGTITMNTDHTLSNTVERILYFQGNWRVSVAWGAQTCALQNESNMAAVGTQNGDDATLVVTTPTLPAPVQCVGKINPQGSFELTAEVDMGGTIMHYSIKGQMTSRDTFTATIDAQGFFNGTLQCTGTGTMDGNRV